jgi:DNA topoisomerase-1
MSSKALRQLVANHRTPNQAAKAVGLTYITDSVRGIRRMGAARRFHYYGPTGRRVRDPGQLRRIASLAIPPAWRDVWISPFSSSHLQATGHDVRGRKQYRYHPHWCTYRDQTKYSRMLLVGGALPKLRARVAKDLSLAGLPRAKVIAAVVKLLEATLIRIGNIEYARENNSFGLTTLRNRHVKVKGATIRFRFRGKSRIDTDIGFSNKKLAQIIRRCQELPGQELFQYRDSQGNLRRVTSDDINEYLRNAAGLDITAKDFRTWAGTVLAARELGNAERADSKGRHKRNIVRAVEVVAKQLGNTRAVCQKSYIHPAIVKAYEDGSLSKLIARQEGSSGAKSSRSMSGAESAVMSILSRLPISESSRKAA